MRLIFQKGDKVNPNNQSSLLSDIHAIKKNQKANEKEIAQIPEFKDRKQKSSSSNKKLSTKHRNRAHTSNKTANTNVAQP